MKFGKTKVLVNNDVIREQQKKKPPKDFVSSKLQIILFLHFGLQISKCLYYEQKLLIN